VAEAQPATFTGLLSGHIGIAANGDVRDATAMPGASLAVLDANGLGVELDVSHAGDFDDSQFVDSSITTVMLNFVAAYPHDRIRPFLIAGGGVLRVRAAPDGGSAAGKTDAAWNAGGGVLYMFSEAFALRADVRYFRHAGRQEAFPLGGNDRLEFVRTSFGVTFSWPMS
jgi:opacity protein-like surface antigen